MTLTIPDSLQSVRNNLLLQPFSNDFFRQINASKEEEMKKRLFHPVHVCKEHYAASLNLG